MKNAISTLTQGSIALVIAAALLSGCETSSASEDAGSPAGRPDMKVKATKIIKEFEKNEASADAKYKGKTLEVSGVVSKVDTDMWNEEQYVIQVNGGGRFEFLNVNCNGITAKVAGGIKVKKPITVVGAFDDGGDLGIELKNCRVA